MQGFNAKSVANSHGMTAVRASTETYMAADKHMDDADALALHKDTASGTNSLGKLPPAAAAEEAAVLFPSARPGALSYAWPLHVQYHARARPLNKRVRCT